MSASNFWPRAEKYDVHLLTLHIPDQLSEQAKLLMQETLVLTDMLRMNQNAQHCQRTQLDALLTLRLAAAFRSLSYCFTDKDTKTALEWRARTLEGGEVKRKHCEKILELNEREIVCYSGTMSTWVGKSRELYYSTFYAKPNCRLQNISDVIDRTFQRTLEHLKAIIHQDLISMSSCRYKIVDLFGISGEANLYPKHFAYFMPEDEGVKHANCKRTIVFSNVYTALFDAISIKQLDIFGWHAEDLPHKESLGEYLIAWFRGHDLGHSIMTNRTSFSKLSKLDRWGSMVMQEALADIFGLLLCSHERSANELNIDNTKLARIYLLEMLRYMRRGPCDFPDAGAAYVQFKFLVECGCLKITENGNVSVYLERFYPSITKLAKHLTENILQGDDESAALFISKYCPNNDLQDCAKLIDTIGIVADTIEYEQKIREV